MTRPAAGRMLDAVTEDFANPSPVDIAAFLRGVRRIAVVGLSPKAVRPSHQVARAVQGMGYEIVPVRPAVDQILDARAYPRLADVPGEIDLVDVFRSPEQVPEVVDECIARGVPGIWLQDGIVAPEAAQRARDAGLFVVMDDCLARFLRRMKQA